MEKLDPKTDGTSPDIVGENIQKLKDLFPSVFTEGKVDFVALKETLGDYIDERQERYSFTWNGKARSRHIAQTPSTGTLRPCPDESLNWDTTQNLFIEGDNLEVLKLLQKSYHKQIKIIYIDPPYNTGNEFIYPDKYQDNLETYLNYTGQIDACGFKISAKNTEQSGRYHTNWLNMMYPRLKLARNLLTDDGVILISIDDHEVTNLRNLCDLIYGEENFISTLVWEKKKKGAFLSGHITNVREFIVCYAKHASTFDGLIGEIARDTETYPVIKTTNARGERIIRAGIPSKYREANHKVQKGSRISSGNMELIPLDDLVIKDRVLQSDVRVDSNWIYSQELLDEYADKGELYVTQDLYFRRIVNEPRHKRLKDLLPRVGKSGVAGDSYQFSEDLFHDGWGTNEDGNAELHELLGVQNIFQFPKPSKLMAKIFASFQDNDCIVLDFFAGSATTGHAVWELQNNAKKMHRFVLVQLPERIDPTDNNFKRAYDFCNELNVPPNLAEIGKERLRRVIKKIEANQKEKAKEAKQKLPNMGDDIPTLDLGFKVFKLDASNIKPWDPDFDKLEDSLFNAVENIKPDRSEADVLYELLLKYGLDLSVPIEERKLYGKTVYIIGAGALVVCLSKQISLEVVEGIAALKDELKPEVMRVVFKDSGFVDDVVKTNAVQILRQAGIDDVKSL